VFFLFIREGSPRRVHGNTFVAVVAGVSRDVRVLDRIAGAYQAAAFCLR
jgi:hypothetical protein